MKKANIFDFIEDIGLYWTCLDAVLVEVAGIEPASVSSLPLDLHA